jgi:hypothetical protein
MAGWRIADIRRALVLGLVAAALVCPIASARSLRLATPVTVVRPAVGDGRRWIAWTETAGRLHVVDATTATQRTVEQPGCYAGAIAFGRLLSNCVSPEPGPRVLNLTSGATYAPPPGQPPQYTTGFDPFSDSFGDLGRYWLIGFRVSSDPHVQGHTVYLNLRDGHISQADGPRDLDTLGLDRLHGHCPTPNGPTPRYRLVFGALGARHALRLMSCATGRSKVISRCARGCQALGAPLNPDVLIWLQGRSAIHAIRPATGDQHVWVLPRPTPQNPPYVQAALGANRLFVSRPVPQTDGTTGWRIYTATVPRP